MSLREQQKTMCTEVSDEHAYQPGSAQSSALIF